MCTINQLIEIFKQFENGDFNLYELQSRLNTFSMRDHNSAEID
ncbi:hypothetical protein [Lysinibacillus sp. SGAir0095]|nr:hypothetical protein [Lysinibacillus sp. SGAir0095]